MNFKIDELSGIYFGNIETGETFELSGATMEVDTLSPNDVPDIRTFGTCEATFTCENAMINEDLLSELLLPEKPNTFDLEFTAMVQARKHRKKRINKKWLNRYGYKPMKMNFSGWRIDTYNTQTGEVELVKI